MIKVESPNLVMGMFVSELDRPWTETSFLLQGVLIESDDDIQEFTRVCEFVYVDEERSHESVISQLAILKNQKITARPEKEQIQYTAKMADEEQALFRKELKHARKVHKNTRGYIDQALEDVRLGNSLDTEAARVFVSEIADSVSRAPNAMLWLTHMKKRDEYTSIHCINVCILAVTFGRALGIEKKELNILGMGALLHDLGKMKIPLEILNKPARLTPEEYELMKTHSHEGYKMLNEKGDMHKDILDIVLSHHERIDGSGYPNGTSDELISQLTQITSVVDVYDAITSNRCYHDGIPPYDAMKMMYEWSSKNFVPDLIEGFIKCLGIYPIGSLVKLNSRHIGVVVAASEKVRLRPIIMLVIDRKGERLDVPKLLNLAHPQWIKGKTKLKIQNIVNPDDYDIDLAAIVADAAIM